MMQKLAKTVRVITVPPFMAAVMLLLLIWIRPGVYRNAWDCLLSVVFLTVLPLLAYVIQPVVPGFKYGGRDAQRDLAMVMSVLGYLLGILYAAIFGAACELLSVFVIYMLSVIGLLVLNRLFHIKASGHACGVAGPIAYLFVVVGAWAFVALPVFALVCWSSVTLKRHTLSQLLWGGAVSAVGAVLVALAF